VHRVVLSQERYPSEIIERVGVKDCKKRLPLIFLPLIASCSTI
jgi:hypothetical protein